MRNAKFVLLTLIFPCLTWAQETNYNFENYGNRSVLLSGNVTGSVEDLGLAFYNPSRLAMVKNDVFTVNAKIYSLSRVRVENDLGQERAIINNSQFLAVPALVAGTFKWKGEQFAYSAISRYRHEVRLQYDSPLTPIEDIDGIESTTRIRLNSIAKDEWVGLSWAKSLSDNFSVGVSAFLSVNKSMGGTEAGTAFVIDTDRTAYFNRQIAYSMNSYGLFWKIGASYRLDEIDLGATVTLPYIELMKDGNYDFHEISSGLGPGFDNLTIEKFEKLDTQRKQPLGIAVGAGIPIRRSKLHLNLDWHAGRSAYTQLSVPSFQIDASTTVSPRFRQTLNPVLNYGAGAEIYLNQILKGYVSFSTDFSAEKNTKDLFDLTSSNGLDIDFSEDFLHIAGGFEISLNWAHLMIGSIYTTGSSKYLAPIHIPGNIYEMSTSSSKIHYNRWNFIVGFEIPFLASLTENKKED